MDSRSTIGVWSGGRDPWAQEAGAVLELAFEHLSAESAKSWVLEENQASISVSTKLGYRLADRHVVTERGRTHAEHVYQLDRDAWLRSPVRHRHGVVVTNVEPLAELLAR